MWGVGRYVQGIPNNKEPSVLKESIYTIIPDNGLMSEMSLMSNKMPLWLVC